MKVLKEKSREYNGKEYYRYRINIPEEIINEAQIKEGDELDATAKKGEIHLKKK
ncbi:MAG: AbrB/MazE/SpoVT family DNA-binding domain-containing protein [Candidatus Staskawiczbacteria bacterium]|nr:AbrB/MazE/SpoVT family DNA-binding domain-containing protein [Candidatus Staskawiczbacteria bacterium]